MASIGKVEQAEAEYPLSLYLQLGEGSAASAEVVAQLLLAWDDLIREIVYIVDPSLEVRVEIVSGTQGSLSLNTLVKAITRVAKKRPILTGAIMGILALFMEDPVTHLSKHFWEEVYERLGHKDDKSLTPEELAEAIEQAEKVSKDNVAGRQKREIFAQLDRDPAVSGVGVSPGFNTLPPHIIPRSEFAERAELEVIVDQTVEARTIYSTKTVTLLRAVLKPEPAMWRFDDGDEFSAKMKDAIFLQALESGATGMPLKVGNQMRIQFERKQEKRDGVWYEVEVNAVKVYEPSYPGQQGSLF